MPAWQMIRALDCKMSVDPNIVKEHVRQET